MLVLQGEPVRLQRMWRRFRLQGVPLGVRPAEKFPVQLLPVVQRPKLWKLRWRYGCMPGMQGWLLLKDCQDRVFGTQMLRSLRDQLREVHQPINMYGVHVFLLAEQLNPTVHRIQLQDFGYYLRRGWGGAFLFYHNLHNLLLCQTPKGGSSAGQPAIE